MKTKIQQFDNSGQEKKKRKSVTVCDIPCEDKIRKFDNSGQEKKIRVKIKFEKTGTESLVV